MLKYISMFGAGFGVASLLFLLSNVQDVSSERVEANTGKSAQSQAVNAGNKRSASTSPLVNNSLPAVDYRDQFLPPTLSGLSEADQLAAVSDHLTKLMDEEEFISQRSDEASRTFLGKVRQLATNDPEEAMRLIETHLEGGLFDYALEIVFPALAKQNLAVAEAALARLKGEDAVRLAVTELAYAWSAQDIDGALDWVERMAVSAQNNESYEHAVKAYRVVMSRYASENPSGAATIINALEAGSVRDELVELLAPKYARQDPQGAVEWVQKVAEKSPEAGRQAYREVVATWAIQSPSQALEFVLGEESLKADEEMVRALLAATTEVSPETVAGFYEQLPEVNRNTAANYIAMSWLQKNPEAATQWVESLSAGSHKDYALGGVVDYYLHHLPDGAEQNQQVFQSAFDYARQIQTERRAGYLKEVIDTWSGLSFEQALEAIKQADNLNPIEREQLMQVIAIKKNPSQALPIVVLPGR